MEIDMEKFKIIIPCLFGLEALVAKELKWLGYDTLKTEDGKVSFLGDFEAVCRANLWLRCGERVLIEVAEFDAFSFDELFEQTKSIKWSDWLPKSAAFPVKGFCLKSQLASMRDCQAIIKKAIADSMSSSYSVDWLPETGALYQIQFSVMKDRVTLMIDTSGDGLHKRGYRRISNAAPLKETIAAAMVMLSFWKFEYPLCDPFCGSGTIPIEAAMFKKNIAPGLSRNFSAENFEQISADTWRCSRDEAHGKVRNTPLNIIASDIDRDVIPVAIQNAKIAGVGDSIAFSHADATKFISSEKYGSIICNPPYGERLSDKLSCEELYMNIGKNFSQLPDWSYYILASSEDFEKHFGKKADKRRKIYNGMIKCNIYQYFGKRPPKKTETI
jgi:putative N6-adenine-specific DNA methylase